MRDGDRDAAAEFVTRYGSRIRRRVRGKLGPGMRRLFDSQDILSTLGRRLDRVVHDERVEAQNADEFWALVMAIANNAVVDKARVCRRLQRVEGEDSDFANAMLTRMRNADNDDGDSDGEGAIESAFGALPDDVDKRILSMWLVGSRHTQIANGVGLSPAAVRQRWQSIKSRLRERLA